MSVDCSPQRKLGSFTTIFMLQSLLANRPHDTWRDRPEQIGNAMWLGLGFKFHTTIFSLPLLPTCLMAVFVEDIDKVSDSFNSVKCAPPGKKLCSPLSDNSPHVGHWTKASMGINSWIFLNDGKPAFRKPTPSQNWWIIDIGAVQHVWRTIKRAGFDYLETQSLNQDPVENTFGVIHLHCGSNNNPTVGQFVDALKTSIISGLVHTCLHNANCEADDHRSLSFWIIYIPSSRNLMLLHQIHPKVTEGRPIMMVLVALILQSKCSGRWMMLTWISPR